MARTLNVSTETPSTVRSAGWRTIPGGVGVTNTANDTLALPPAGSVTSIVTVAVPVRLRAGVIRTVRSVSLPPKAMLSSGTSAASLETAFKLKLPIGVSGSSIVKAIDAVGVFSGVV